MKKKNLTFIKNKTKKQHIYIYIYIYIYICIYVCVCVCVSEDRLKSQLACLCALIEYDQIRSIFQHSFNLQSTHFFKQCLGYICENVINRCYGLFWLWFYASHRAQCSVTSSYRTFCGCCVPDYHICFRQFTLSSPSVPTLCLKDPRSGVDTIQPDFLHTVR